MKKLLFCLTALCLVLLTSWALADQTAPALLLDYEKGKPLRVEIPPKTIHAKNLGVLANAPEGSTLVIDDAEVMTSACGAGRLCFEFSANPTPAKRKLHVVLKNGTDVLGDQLSAEVTFIAEAADKQPAPKEAPQAQPASAWDQRVQAAYFAAIDTSPLSPADKKKYKDESPGNVYVDTFFGTDVAILLYTSKGEAVFSPIPEVDEDDTIIVAIVQEVDEPLPRPKVTACSAAPAVRIGGSLKPPGEVSLFVAGTEEAPKFWIAKAKGCASENGLRIVGATPAATGGGATTVYEIAIPTLSLNRLTLGLGIVYDLSVETEFRGATVKGENVPVIVRDQHVRGIIPPVAMISLRPFKVDAQRTRIGHRIIPAPTLGISVTEPLDHVFLGLLVEPMPGLGAVAGYHLHREPILAGGFKEGDRLPTGSIPTDKRWGAGPNQDRNWFFGINIDAVMLVNLVGKLL